MGRRIVLELAEDADAKFCGSCPMKVGDDCMTFGVRLRVVPFDRQQQRASECLAAERQAERMVEIAPEDAAIVVVQRTCVGEDPEPHRRVYGALRDHARKAKR